MKLLLMKQNLEVHHKADFILYAKGHYKTRTVDGTVWGDLKRIQSEWSGIGEEHISTNDIITSLIILTEEVVPKISLLNFLIDITPEHFWEFSTEQEYSLYLAIVYKCLSLIRFIRVIDKNGNNIIELGEANPKILPLSKQTIDRRKNEL